MSKRTTKRRAIKDSNLYYYSISIVHNDDVLSVDTDNVEDALNSFKPEFIKGKTVIKVSKNGKNWEQVVFAAYARRLFYNPLTVKIFARNILRALA